MAFCREISEEQNLNGSKEDLGYTAEKPPNSKDGEQVS